MIIGLGYEGMRVWVWGYEGMGMRVWGMRIWEYEVLKDLFIKKVPIDRKTHRNSNYKK